LMSVEQWLDTTIAEWWGSAAIAFGAPAA